MKGQHLAIGLLVALFGAVGAVFWIGATGQGRASELGQAQAASASRARQRPSEAPKLDHGDDAGTVTTAPIDREARDD